MQKILIIEDSPIVLKILRHLSQELSEFDVIFAASRKEAAQEIKKHRSNIFVALADLNLPDAPNGEVVDDCLKNHIPTLVLTGTMDSTLESNLINKGVLDYVIKDSRYSYQHAIKAINNLKKNQHSKVLVAEDSSPIRKHICQVLSSHMFKVFEASDGVEALNVLNEHPDIDLLITDYNMPNMDGFELVAEIRSNLKLHRLSILGLSSLDTNNISVRFIRNGADDYLPKPFKLEEFNCRVDRILESNRLLKQMEDLSFEDPLTGLHNRRYFYSKGRDIYNQAKQSGKEIFAVVMDIDHFKGVNDNYSHDAGDKVLIHLGQKIQEFFSRFITARAGGEEFCALIKGLSEQQTFKLLDQFRASLEEDMIFYNEHQLSVTISIGMTNEVGDSLEEFMHHADTLLYAAKEGGRNMVVSG